MERSWIYRRVVVFYALGFSSGLLVALFVAGDDTMLAREMAQGAWMLLGATIGAYVFGAAWDDRNKAKEILDGIGDHPAP